MTTDASTKGVGAVLSQYQDNMEKVTAFAGVSFNEVHSATDKELAAIRYTVQHFKAYLYGSHFDITTDHEPLIYLNHMKRVDDRLHMTEELVVGHYTLEYVPKKNNNVVADTLSQAEYPWVLPAKEDYSIHNEQPEFGLANRVPGDPNSLFESLSALLQPLSVTAPMVYEIH